MVKLAFFKKTRGKKRGLLHTNYTYKMYTEAIGTAPYDSSPLKNLYHALAFLHKNWSEPNIDKIYTENPISYKFFEIPEKFGVSVHEYIFPFSFIYTFFAKYIKVYNGSSVFDIFATDAVEDNTHDIPMNPEGYENMKLWNGIKKFVDRTTPNVPTDPSENMIINPRMYPDGNMSTND